MPSNLNNERSTNSSNKNMRSNHKRSTTESAASSFGASDPGTLERKGLSLEEAREAISCQSTRTRLRRYVSPMVPHDCDADDVTQEVLLRATKAIYDGKFDSARGTLWALLSVIVRNEVRRHFGRMPKFTQTSAAIDEQISEPIRVNEWCFLRVVEDLLSEEYPVLAADYAGRSTRTTAHIMDITEGSVYRRRNTELDQFEAAKSAFDERVKRLTRQLEAEPESPPLKDVEAVIEAIYTDIQRRCREKASQKCRKRKANLPQQPEK